MDFYAKAERLSDKDFKQIIGVKKVTFDAMVKILKEAYARKSVFQLRKRQRIPVSG